jgi:predicted enzyme related to lactoylglutathione lyase
MSRAIQFYKTVFGWDIQKTQMPMEYYLATTGKEGTNGINGAIMERKGATSKTVVNTIEVPSFDVSAKQIVEAGGKLVTKKDLIPTIGYFAYFTDTEGNLFGLLEPVMS